MIGLALVTIIAATTLVANRKPKIQNNDYSTINFKPRSTGLFDEDDEYEEQEKDQEADLANGSSSHKKKAVEFKRENENPQDRIGFFSTITYSWITDFMKFGTKMTYTIDDVYPPRKGI